MRKKPLHHAIIAAGILCTGLLFWRLLAPSSEGQTTIDELREMLRKGASPEIRARGASGLGERRDTPSMPLLLAAIEDDSPLVRGQAAVAVKKILGADFRFRPDDSPEVRQPMLQAYRDLWEAWKEKTGYTGELVYPDTGADEDGGST